MGFEKTERTDEDLMKSYLAGDLDAFEHLALRYEKLLVNYAYSFLRRQSVSEDIVQDVFMKLVENKKNYDANRPFRPWIYRIARNRIYDELRKIRRWNIFHFRTDTEQEAPQQIGEIPDPLCSPRETLNQSELCASLQKGLGKLNTRSRDLLVLRYLQGLPVREVSEILGIPEGTVHSGTHRALKSLEKILNQYGITGEDLP